MVAAAMVGGTLIGGVASNMAASKGAKAQQGASDASIAEQRRQYDQIRSDLAPWRESGGQARNRLAIMMGLLPYSPQQAPQVPTFGHVQAGATMNPNTQMGPSLAPAPAPVIDHTQDPYWGTGIRKVNPELDNRIYARTTNPELGGLTYMKNPTRQQAMRRLTAFGSSPPNVLAAAMRGDRNG